MQPLGEAQARGARWQGSSRQSWWRLRQIEQTWEVCVWSAPWAFNWTWTGRFSSAAPSFSGSLLKLWWPEFDALLARADSHRMVTLPCHCGIEDVMEECTYLGSMRRISFTRMLEKRSANSTNSVKTVITYFRLLALCMLSRMLSSSSSESSSSSLTIPSDSEVGVIRPLNLTLDWVQIFRWLSRRRRHYRKGRKELEVPRKCVVNWMWGRKNEINETYVVFQDLPNLLISQIRNIECLVRPGRHRCCYRHPGCWGNWCPGPKGLMSPTRHWLHIWAVRHEGLIILFIGQGACPQLNIIKDPIGDGNASPTSSAPQPVSGSISQMMMPRSRNSRC